MSQQAISASQTIDINILLKEYESLISQLTSENLRYKALIKQIQEQEAVRQAQQSSTQQ